MYDKYIEIPGTKIPVFASPDVCVIGGGVAGVSSAIASARCGLKVLLVEKYGFCGGATVAGLSGTICGLYSSGKKPEQIVFGFAGEFVNLLKSKSGVSEAIAFGKTKLVPHDALVWKEVADNLLESENITVLYHTYFRQVVTNEEGLIKTLVLDTNDGPIAINPKQVIDASGDAAVVNNWGGKTVFGANGVVQTPTMIFKVGGVKMNQFLDLDCEFINQKVIENDAKGKYRLPRHHVYLFPLPNQNEILCNMTRITFPDGRIPSGLNSSDLTFAEMEGRLQSREYFNFLKNEIPSFENSYLADTGTQIGIRQTRSIVGVDTLTNDNVLQAKKSDQSVSFSAWPIEAHGAGELKIKYLEDDFYDIPFGAIVPQNSLNVLAPGRCMSAEHEALASARVTAQCFGMGYAAGVASAVAIAEKLPMSKINGLMVKEMMQVKGLKSTFEK